MFKVSARLLAVLGTALLACSVQAATLQSHVYDQDGKPLADAVVTLKGPANGQPRLKATMDQKGQEYVPHVLAVHSGSEVSFPNLDNIRHQVYSFSPTKRFELRLYEGTPSAPVLFDKAGLVVLGCNIHDWMLGYIYVTDDPWFAVTDAQGAVRFEGLSAASYEVTVWHPQTLDMQPFAAGSVTVPAQGLSRDFSLSVQPARTDAPSAPAPSAFGNAFKKAAGETAQ